MVPSCISKHSRYPCRANDIGLYAGSSLRDKSQSGLIVQIWNNGNLRMIRVLLRSSIDGLGTALRLDQRTVSGLKFDLQRALTRWRYHRNQLRPQQMKLQLGAGRRAVDGWLNCDIVGSDYDVDLASPPLPFPDGHFTDIVCQHTIEHLEYDPQVLNLFSECHRILQPGGKVWFSCPDLEKICLAYIEDRCATIDQGLKRHWPHAHEDGFPVQHRINFYFHQWGEHRNLFDFEMLRYALMRAGFSAIMRSNEADFLRSYPNFPPRNDDFESIYVSARKPTE